MQSTSIIIAVFIVVGSTVEYQSIFTAAINHEDSALPQSRNIFQQLLINQIINVLPVDARNGINDAAALFGMTRNEFLVRCLKELQAFQAYSKIDFITAIQKAMVFTEKKLADEHKEALESSEEQGVELAKLIFSNQLKAGEMNKFYDLVVKIVRQQIDGQTLVNEIPKLIDEILLKHA